MIDTNKVAKIIKNESNIANLTGDEIINTLYKHIDDAQITFWEKFKKIYKDNFGDNVVIIEKKHYSINQISNDDLFVKVLIQKIEETLNKQYVDTDKILKENAFLYKKPLYKYVCQIINNALKYFRYTQAQKIIISDDVPTEVMNYQKSITDNPYKFRMQKYISDIETYCFKEHIEINSAEFQELLLTGYKIDYDQFKEEQLKNDDIMGRNPTRYQVILLGLLLDLDVNTVELLLKKGLSQKGLNPRHPLDYICLISLSSPNKKYATAKLLEEKFDEVILSDYFLEMMTNSNNKAYSAKLKKDIQDSLDNKALNQSDDLVKNSVNSIMHTLLMSKETISKIAQQNKCEENKITGFMIKSYAMEKKRANNPYSLSEKSVSLETEFDNLINALKVRIQNKDVVEKREKSIDLFNCLMNLLKGHGNSKLFKQNKDNYIKKYISNQVFERKLSIANYSERDKINTLNYLNKYLIENFERKSNKIVINYENITRRTIIITAFLCYFNDPNSYYNEKTEKNLLSSIDNVKNSSKFKNGELSNIICSMIQKQRLLDFENYMNKELKKFGYYGLYYRDPFDSIALVSSAQLENNIDFFAEQLEKRFK